MRIRAILGAVVLLSACGGSSGGEGGGGGGGGSATGGGTGGGTGSNVSLTVNGKPAADYYAQFVYEKSERYIEGAVAFQKQPDGNNTFYAAVFLRSNQSALIYYKEGTGSVSTDGWSISVDSRRDKRKVSTSWSYDANGLHIGNLSCVGMTRNGGEGLYCTLETAIGYSDAVAHSGFFANSLSRGSPDDSEWADYR